MPRDKGWLEKSDAWFASQNIRRISSLVAKANMLICTPPRDDAMRCNETEQVPMLSMPVMQQATILN
jgi:hypothetical protein